MPTDTTTNGRITRTPDERRLYRWGHLDQNRRYITDNPSATKFVSILKRVDGGDVAALVEMDEEMLAKDAHLQGVANTRRLAVLALDWFVDPDIGTGDEGLAKEAAQYVSETFHAIESFPEFLSHNQSAIGPNIAVTELVWGNGTIVDTVPIPGNLLFYRPEMGPGMRIMTLDDPFNGIECSRGKFVCYSPNPKPGLPLTITITRAQAILYLLKHFAIADWATFSELFAMPIRIATYKKGAQEEEKSDVENMLRDLSSDAWGMFSEDVTIDFKEANKGTATYSDLVKWIESRQSILYLGQTLTTEIGQFGSFAAAKVHDNVRADILISDLRAEANCIRNQVIRPLVEIAFPGRSAPIPHFRREILEGRNIDWAERLKLEKIGLMAKLGLPMLRTEMYELLGITQPKPGEEVVEPTPEWERTSETNSADDNSVDSTDAG